MIARFTVPGEPQGKGRPRFTGRGRAYTPKKTAQYEAQIRRAYQSQAGQVFPEGIPLAVKIVAYYGVPTSDSKRKRADKLTHRVRPTKKPDWDNIGKVICDALNGLAYKDDAQIVAASVYKCYGEQPRINVTIAAVKADNAEPQHVIPANTEKPRRAACKRSHGEQED